MKTRKVRKKVKGKVAHYRHLRLPVPELNNKRVTENENVRVVIGIKNEKGKEVEIDIVKEETEVEVEIEIAVEKEFVAEKEEAVTEIVVVKETVVVKENVVDATEVALLTVRGTTEEKTETVETAKIETEDVNRNVIGTNVAVIVKNQAKRRILKRVAMFRLILKLQKQMHCVQN